MADKRDLQIKRRGGHARPPKSVPEPSPSPRTVPTDSEEPELVPVPRRRRRKSTFLRVAIRLVVLAALCLAAVLVWRNWDTLAPDRLLERIEEWFSGGEGGDGFPVEITGSDVVDMATVKNHLALLTYTELLLYNDNGGEVARRSHGYADPLLKTAGEYALVAELGGTRFRLETRRATLLDVISDQQAKEEDRPIPLDEPLSYPIVSAAVGADGTVAVVTTASQSTTSELVVYSKKGKRLLTYKNKDLQAVDVAVSEDGKTVAAVCLSAEGGAMKSTLQVFRLGEDQPKVYTDTDVMLFAVDIFPGGTVIAAGDSAVWVVNPTGTLFNKQTYADYQLLGYAAGQDSAGLALRHYGSTDGGELMVISPAGDVVYQQAFTGTFRHLAAGDGDLLLLTSGHLLRAGAAQMGEALPVAADGRLVTRLGKKAVVLGLSSLEEYTP